MAASAMMMRARQPLGGVARRLCAQLSTASASSETEGAAERSFFAGARSEYTTEPTFWRPHVDAVPPSIPCFRLLDDLGVPCPGAETHLPKIDRDTAVAMQTTMVRVSEFDKVYNEAQRQGRISFYMTSRGEEACSVASCVALEPTDWLLPQYRELGAMFWRGLTFEDIANQLCANAKDNAHGRQLPLHIGRKDAHILYVKSTLGTQCPQAAGVAYAMRTQGKQQAALTYFGEGCASEGDVPSALNIAAVHDCPTIFFCRNNGYAISTSPADQYVSDGIAPRGIAYGMPTIRIDGNDLLAVYVATRKVRAAAAPAAAARRRRMTRPLMRWQARQIAIEERRPAMIEAMTYRIGAHSTSDDDSKYRTQVGPTPGPAVAAPPRPHDPPPATRRSLPSRDGTRSVPTGRHARRSSASAGTCNRRGGTLSTTRRRCAPTRASRRARAAVASAPPLWPRARVPC